MDLIDWSGDAFARALDEAGRRASEPRDEPAASVIGAFGLSFEVGPERGGGGETRWARAREWAGDPPAPLAAHPTPPYADVAESVTRELGFSAGMTAHALTERWRAFVWLNHPDRQPPEARERANARVAAANALYDRARRGLFQP